jgi:hypothetical protein
MFFFCYALCPISPHPLRLPIPWPPPPFLSMFCTRNAKAGMDIFMTTKDKNDANKIC